MLNVDCSVDRDSRKPTTAIRAGGALIFKGAIGAIDHHHFKSTGRSFQAGKTQLLSLPK